MNRWRRRGLEWVAPFLPNTDLLPPFLSCCILCVFVFLVLTLLSLLLFQKSPSHAPAKTRGAAEVICRRQCVCALVLVTYQILILLAK